MPLASVINVHGIPLRGGCVTVRDKGLLKPGEFSMVQNVLPQHPGFSKRKGQSKQHSTVHADYASSDVLSVYQYKKTSQSENIVLVQTSGTGDGDVQSLTTNPPGTTTGNMGTAVYEGTEKPNPPSWNNLNDMLLYSNGVDQHKIYNGTTSYVKKFIVYKGTGTLSTTEGYLEGGFDYTDDVSDTSTSTVAVLNDLADNADGDGIYICTHVPATSFTITMQNVNTQAKTGGLAGYFWASDHSWTALTGFTDGTETSSCPFGVTGNLTFTAPTTIQPRYLFGTVGYWYLLVLSNAADYLDAAVSISKVTYASAFTSWQPLWNGVYEYAVEVLVEGSGYWDKYSADNVDLDALAAGKKVYICSADPIEGIYFDTGATENVNTTAVIDKINYWDGDSWVDTGAVAADDGTGDGTDAALSRPGWFVFPRKTDAMPQALKMSKVYGYWYEVYWKTAAMSDDTACAIYTMPFYAASDYGSVGQCNCVWKERALWTWADKYPEYVYISGANNPWDLTSSDAAIIEVGDGRSHKVVAMRSFFNNVLVWQEERGEIGGCITMLQGYNPATFGKLVLSTKIGTLNNKTVDVVENVFVSTATDQSVKTVAFFLSRYGVCATDGTAIWIISDPIQNYFDPRESTTCINTESDLVKNRMWLKHDPVDHVLRIGLCTGTSTTPNVFPVFDLIDMCWYFDVRGQALYCWDNLEAASGNVPISQVAGGGSGQLYIVNSGTADVSTAIDTYIRIEFPGYGSYVDLLQFLFTCEAQTATLYLNTYQNNIAKDTLAPSSAAEYSTQEIRRNLYSLNIVDQHVAIKLGNTSTTESMTLYATGVELKLWQNR